MTLTSEPEFIFKVPTPNQFLNPKFNLSISPVRLVIFVVTRKCLCIVELRSMSGPGQVRVRKVRN